MSLANFIRLAEECDGRTYQFALGGMCCFASCRAVFLFFAYRELPRSGV